MLEDFKININQVVESVSEKYQNMAISAKELNKDILEIRDFFVSVKNILSSISAFIGYETGVLIFCTFLFLLFTNMIPFLFFSKKGQYFCGIGVGVFLCFSLEYTFYSLVKYVVIMLSPILIEFTLAYLFRKLGRVTLRLIKKSFFFLGSETILFSKKLLKRKEKMKPEQKNSSQ